MGAMLAKRRAQVKGAFGPRAGYQTTLGTLVPAPWSQHSRYRIPRPRDAASGTRGYGSPTERGEEMSKVRLIVIAALIAGLVAAAAIGARASWKWSGKTGKADAPYKIAGWSWGDSKRAEHSSEF
jgi:hypothetical protein